MRAPSSLRRRRRVGRVTVYQRSKRFWIYYRQGGQPVRMPAGPQQDEALRVAAKVNAELAEGARPSLQFRPISIEALISQWLDQHEHIRRSSLATVRRYRTAVHHLTDFLASRHGVLRADRFNAGMAEQFVRYLRGVQVAPNGHPHAARRPLRDKGVIFILETCRALFSFAARQRHLPASRAGRLRASR